MEIDEWINLSEFCVVHDHPGDYPDLAGDSMKNTNSRIRIALIVAGLFAAGLAHADAVTDNAKALLDKGDAKAAYALLEPLEAERAGDPGYDFLLGLAALETGKNTNAVFALERVLAVDPNHVRARAEIARAYAALGETKTAKQEFETVKKQGVPPEVAVTIDRVLSAIERVEDEGRTTVRGYVEGTIGHDTNVNSATADRNVAVPLFGGAIFTLGPGGVQRSDTFTSVGGGLSLRKPLDKEWALTAGLNGSKRMNTDVDEFDTGSTDAHLGVVRTYGKDVFSAALQYNQFWVDNDRYREAAGFTAQWQHNYDARHQSSLYVQYSDLRYMSQGVRNADRFVIGANFAKAMPGFKTVFYGGAYLGEEAAKKDNFEHLGHILYGMRIGAQHEIHRDARAFANLGYEHRRYGGEDPFFLKTRTDNQWNLSLGVAWTPAKNWRVTPQFQYTDTRSNIDLNRFRREVVSVTVRREF
jgi:tetratricopeptide (TPR) repeat protein